MASIPKVGIRLPPWASFAADVCAGVLDFMRLNGPWHLQTISNNTNEMEPLVIDKDWDGDGLITLRVSDEEQKAFKKRGIPVVNISRDRNYPNVPSVVVDNVEIGKIAARHLVTLGLERLVYCGDSGRLYSRERRDGFRQEVLDRGLEFTELDVPVSTFPWDRKWEKVYWSLYELFEKIEGPVGVLARDDIQASNIVNVCHDLNIRVPRDLAIVGVNNDETFAHTTLPPISSIQYPGKRIGFEAASILNAMLIGEKVRASTLVKIAPGNINVRESTDVLAFKNKHVAKAVRMIRRRAPFEPIRVEDLHEGLPLSRTEFNRKFVDEMGVSPKREIIRVRCEHVCELLKSTDRSVQEIAQSMGFRSSEDLARFMKREMNLSATDYRKGL